ncbi:ABC transporter ATP-binding protein [Curtobacterium sp. RRHDQ10]|uniref:ABC transporter ATP-binding protein n=1 Tax=Curtobacterium phyllosphaerae TaxID=3413379 RepID=UPI003BF3BDF4
MRDVTRVFASPDGGRLDVLRGTDLVVDAGERVAIVGRSGSGKSTLLNIAGLLDAPSSGRHEFLGIDATRLSSGRRDRLRGHEIGFVFQQFNLMQGLTALENVVVPLLYATGAQFWRRRAVAADMLDRVGLSSRLDALPTRMSGGEQQRVAIARALVQEPALILADEPTGALDGTTGDTVMTLLETVATESGAALVTITHDPSVAARAHVVHTMADGRMDATAPTTAPTTVAA